jgi:hypothetical protein
VVAGVTLLLPALAPGLEADGAGTPPLANFTRELADAVAAALDQASPGNAGRVADPVHAGSARLQPDLPLTRLAIALADVVDVLEDHLPAAPSAKAPSAKAPSATATPSTTARSATAGSATAASATATLSAVRPFTAISAAVTPTAAAPSTPAPSAPTLPADARPTPAALAGAPLLPPPVVAALGDIIARLRATLPLAVAEAEQRQAQGPTALLGEHEALGGGGLLGDPGVHLSRPEPLDAYRWALLAAMNYRPPRVRAPGPRANASVKRCDRCGRLLEPTAFGLLACPTC